MNRKRAAVNVTSLLYELSFHYLSEDNSECDNMHQVKLKAL